MKRSWDGGGSSGTPAKFGGKGKGKGKGGKGKGKGGFGREEETPEYVVELGEFMHPCESDMVCKSTNEKIPYFNAGAYLEDKQRIGKVDEILGPINTVMFTVKPETGVNAFATATQQCGSSDNVAAEVRESCDGKGTCDVVADTSEFGDMGCATTYKYLEYSYECV